jgi:methionyl-tRNA formyltransferase
MKIFFLGNGQRAKACLEKIIETDDITSIIVEPSRSGDIVEDFSNEHDIPVYYPNSFTEGSDGYQLLQASEAELAILCGYTKIVPSEFLNHFRSKKGTVNLHGGKVPEYRGSSPRSWQIVNGEKQGAFTVLEVDEGIDTSYILAEHIYDITEETTIADVTNLELEVFPKLLSNVLEDVRNETLERKPQEGIARYWHRRKESDAQIHWDTMTAEQVYNLIRAETEPFRGAFTYQGDEKIDILAARKLSDLYGGTPGRVIKPYEEGMIVMAQDTGLLVTQLRCGDKKYSPNDLLKSGTQFTSI